MKWVGKVLGGTFGFLAAGRVGAMIGSILGHQFDRDRLAGSSHDSEAQVQAIFVTSTFAVMGHIAKADGRVSEDEIRIARSLMDRLALNEEQRREAMRLFSEGKSATFPLDRTLVHFRDACRRRYTLIQSFVEFQLEAALADGTLHPAAERILLHVCDMLHFSRFEFHTVKALLQAQRRGYSGSAGGAGSRGRSRTSGGNAISLDEAYATLGVRASASETDIKRSYRRLISKHHPDKLAAEGAPDAQVRSANDKTQRIRRAYETIRKARGFS